MPGKDPARGGVRAEHAPTVDERGLGHENGDSREKPATPQDKPMWKALFGSSDASPQYASDVSFTINGKTYTVGSQMAADTSLNEYLRDVAHLTGTKFMCSEGGCGACVVAASVSHPVTKQRETLAVNSCLVPVLACDGWDITTVEGLGDRRTGYHRVQATLAHFNGTQCGFCSPGMVMNMYSLLERSGKAPSMADVENSFGGNLCRCTGYRPILDAFKSLSTDPTSELKQACLDIEDVYKICKKTGAPCSGSCNGEQASRLPVRISTVSGAWHKPRSLNELFTALADIGDMPYKLVCGNTAEGVYKSKGIEAFIDIKDVAELRTTSTSPTFTLGGNVTLTEAMQLFSEASGEYSYLQQLAKHIDKIANVPVRNVGTLAGNLAIKHAHHEFPSDIFTTFETVGAMLNIRDAEGRPISVSLLDFLQLDMNKKVIVNITFPSLTPNHRLRTFKITPRAQNAHAYVNAGFLVQFEDTTSWKVVGQPRIVFGGINPQFVHASQLESFIVNKNLLEGACVTAALAKLGDELIPDAVITDAAPEFRKKLAQALFYKFLIGVDPSKFSAVQQSGADDLKRPLSSGLQDFDTDNTMWPVNQPIPKIEALAQCSGEAEFVNDMPVSPGELHGALVLTTISRGKIAKIDPSTALAMPGVVAFFSHEDITTPNNFTPQDFGFNEREEIFCSGQIRYAGQVVGMVVAETRPQAQAAAQKVELTYSDTVAPALTIDAALREGGDRIEDEKEEPVTEGEETKTEGKEEDKTVVPPPPPTPAHVIKGVFEIGKQYHLTMETQTCLVRPTEGGYDVYVSTQWMDLVQAVVCRTLQVPASQVNVVVRRLGGGYGGKISRPQQFAAACAIAVKKLNRPVRLVMTMSDNMEVVGKRYALRNNYEVGVDNAGKILNLKATFYQDCGFCLNDSPLGACMEFFRNCYQYDSFKLSGRKIRTDTASNTWCRGPGTTEGVAFIEEVMERIAGTLNLDPLAVRQANFTTIDNPLTEMIAELKTKSDYDTRRKAVDDFNAANRWRKRGMAIVPMQYRFGIWGNLPTYVAIHQIDGSVSITHGGIEMGQGLNTKVAQVAAHVLGVPLTMVTIYPSNTVTGANAIVTGGSLGSEAVAYAAMMACQELKARLDPIKKELSDDASWLQIIKKAHTKNVDLKATHMFTAKDNVKPYNIWGATVGEVEVDLLTGEHQVVRVDIMEDVGNSLSPMVDIGQIEGAFVMGMGYWLTEELKHDPDTGRLLNTRTWNYKPPGAKDIPVDFRVHFRKNAPNPLGVLQSKATGEPPLNMAIVVLFAVRNALDSARRDAGAPHEYHMIQPPATTEHIFMNAMTSPEQFIP